MIKSFGTLLFYAHCYVSQITVTDPPAGWGRGGEGKKHEIYAAALGSHLFYDIFLQGRGVMVPSVPPGPATEKVTKEKN